MLSIAVITQLNSLLTWLVPSAIRMPSQGQQLFAVSLQQELYSFAS